MLEAVITFVVLNVSAMLGGHAADYNKQVLQHTERQVVATQALNANQPVTAEVQKREEDKMLAIINK
jgi:hypothetical protein